MSFRAPSVESVATSASAFPPTPPLPVSSPPVVPSGVATPYLDQTPMRGAKTPTFDESLVNDEDDDDNNDDDDEKENRISSEETESGNGSYCGEEFGQIKIDDREEDQRHHHHHHHHHHHYHNHHHKPPSQAADAFLPSTPSAIPLIDESPMADMAKRSYNLTRPSSSSSMEECALKSVAGAASAGRLSPPRKPIAKVPGETPNLPKIRSLSGGNGGAELPVVLKTRQQGSVRGSSLKTAEILPTPMSSSSSSSALSASLLLSSEQKSASLNKFRYTTLWNGAVSALRENVAIKRRKKGGFGLWSSATGTMDIFSGQDATNVLLNYLLEKKAQFKSAQLDRSKAVRLGQQLMNNGYYKPVKKSGSSRGQETSSFEDSASKFYLFCEKASVSSSSSSTAESLLSTSATDDAIGGIGFEGRRNSMRNRKGRLRHPSDPGTPHSRSKMTVAARKRSANGNPTPIPRMGLEDEENKNPDDVTPVNSPAKELGGIVNPAFSTASIPEEVKEIFGPLKMSVQDSIQRVSTTATRFSRSVFSTSSLRGPLPPDKHHHQDAGLFQKSNRPPDVVPQSFGLRSSFGKGAKSATDHFRAPARLRRVFSQNDLRAIGSSTSPSKDEVPSLVSPAVEAEILREAALSRLFSLVDLNILDDVISAVDELVASDTNAVSEGLLLPREEDDEDGSHEILSRWDSQGSLFPHAASASPAKSSEFDSVYHQWLVASSDLLQALPQPSPQCQKQTGTFFNNVAFDVETLDERCLRLFQTTTDAVFSASCCFASSSKKRALPILLPPSLTAVYTAISELLCLGREADALLASQLLALLIPSTRRLVLLRLLQFMNIAVFNSTIRLLIGKSNAAHVFETFAPVIFGKKYAVNLPDWKSFLGHLVRHSGEIKETPQEIKDTVEEKVNMISMRSSSSGNNQNLRRSARFRKSAVQYCQTIDEEAYEEQKVSQTTAALRDLYKSIQDDSSMPEETKNRYLRQMLISHPNLYVTQL